MNSDSQAWVGILDRGALTLPACVWGWGEGEAGKYLCAVSDLHNLTWQPWIQNHLLSTFGG